MRRTRAATPVDAAIGEQLWCRGMRLTVQRRQVYRVLLEELEHPTAEEVFRRAKRALPEISLATVYNCLEALVRCGLVRCVTADPVARRFCSNMAEHGHFYCERCGAVVDVAPVPSASAGRWSLPRGYRARGVEVAIHGVCAGCRGADETIDAE